MQQFDTVKNNQWIPTEDDLQNVIHRCSALPVASETEYGRTYILDGEMVGYTTSHFYICDIDDVTGNYYWRDLQVGRYSVGNCTNIKLMMFDEGDTCRVIISWNDPEDITVGSEIIRWRETRLVHQVGHMPIDINDCIGTYAVCTVRNQYSTFGSLSFSVANDGARKHYFKLFPISQDGAITNDDANGRSAGYNYVITSDGSPKYVDGVPVKTYYKREIDSTTGLISYTALDYNSDNFAGDATTGWKFKTDRVYYEYQNSYITWTGVQELVKNGEAERYFKVGTLLTLPYHGDFGEMAYEVVDYDSVRLADRSLSHSMTLQSKYLYRWWDYNGGVVFDTNEYGGMPTTDVSRDVNKVYFSRIEGTVNPTHTTYNGGGHKTASDQIKTIEGELGRGQQTGGVSTYAALYAETIFDANNYTYSGGDTSTGYEWPSWGNVGTKYECELPYTNPRKAAMTFYGSTAAGGTDSTLANQIYPNQFPSDRKFSTGGTAVVQYPASYSENGAANNKFTINSSSFTCVTYATTTTSDSGRRNIVTPQMCSKAWGIAAIGYGSLSINCGPRKNGYADRFTKVQPLNNNDYKPSGYAQARTYYHGVKYFLPVELVVSRHRAAGVLAGAQTWKYDRTMYLRDCTEDIKRMRDAILRAPAAENAGILDASGNALQNNDYIFVVSSSNYFHFEKFLRDQLLFPTVDEAFQKNKKYYKLTLDDPVTSPSLNWVTSRWYYHKQRYVYQPKGGPASEAVERVFYVRARELDLGNIPAVNTTDADWDDVDFYGHQVNSGIIAGVTYYTRSTGTTKGNHTYTPVTSPVAGSLSTYFIRAYFPAIFRQMTEGGTGEYGYTVGDMVPVESLTPAYVLQKGMEDGDDKAHLANYVWTCGQKDGSGDYISCPFDCRGQYTDDAKHVTGQTQANTDQAYNAMSTSNNVSTSDYSTDFYRSAIRCTHIYEGAVSSYQERSDGSTATINTCNLFYKTPNTERVAYGNHVWAQSNVRMYLNGPMDTTTEYFETPDTTFQSTTSYYKYNAGEGYVRMVKGTDYSDGQAVGAKGYTVYNKCDGGVPVGYKLDLFSPSLYNDYGISPLQQYYFDSDTGTWKERYGTGYNWWTGQASVNNGLVYDRLAPMFQSNCIQIGTSSEGNPVYKFTSNTARSTSGGGSPTYGSNPVTLQTYPTASGTTFQLKANMILPRQSFLHGFLDCAYKRTGDTSAVTGKTYYWKDPYGYYNVVDENDTTLLSNPYMATLYEANGNYTTDLQTADEFLKCVTPVINTNGLYGQPDLYDFYPHSGTGYNSSYGAQNLGGTMTQDKVWLLSTSQVCGGTPTNNGIIEYWKGYIDNVPDRETYFDTYSQADVDASWRSLTNYKYALRKWALCENALYRGLQGYASLNDTRKKYGYSIGQHSSGGYSDYLDDAQYWWLRSAGGEHRNVAQSLTYCQVDGEPTWAESYLRNQPNYWSVGLSPLITLG